MTFVVTDTPRLSQSLLEIILQSLLEPSQRMNPSAFELSKELLRRASVIIEQALVTYFQYNVITSKQTPSLVSSKWDKLIPIMYLISPPLLLNTLPQFEFKLKVDSPKERLQTVQLFSQMFSSKDSLLADQYNKLWLAFLGRFNDIDSEVRCACVRFYWHLTVNHGPTSLMSKEALTFFKPRRHDTDENVRLEVVRAIRGISIHDLRLISDELLGFLEDRVKDKKWKVREGAIRAMADIYRKYVTCSARVRSNVNRLYSFRNSLLHVYYHQSCEDAVLLERMLISSLVPYKSTDEERMKLLLELYVTVDDNSLKAIAEIIKNHCRMQRALHDVIEAFTIESEEERFKQIWPSVVTMASLVPGSTQVAREHIKKFIRAAHQDTRLRQLLTYIVRSDYKCRKIETSVRDILKKVESDGMSKQTRQIIQQILERAVILPIIIDSDALKILFDLVKSSLDEESEIDELNSEKAQKRSLDLLKLLSQLSPHIYNNQECFEDLLVLLRRKNDYVIDSVMLIFEKTAHLLEENFPEIRAFLLPELKKKAEGKVGNSKQAKFSIFCISKMKSIAESALTTIFDYCKEKVADCEELSKLSILFTSMGCIAEVLPGRVAMQLRNVIANTVVKQVIMKTSQNAISNAAGLKSRKNASYWCEKTAVGDETKTKIAGMKCMVRWLIGMKSNESNVCGSSLRLLQHMLHNNGDLMKTGNIPQSDMCHLRLQAACCILKIAQVRQYRDLFTPLLYLELAMMVNDSELEIRRIFINKLYCALFCFHINISFLSLFAMVSQETSKEQRERGTALYHQLVRRFREFNKDKGVGSTSPSPLTPEYMLPHLIYLLADDPDFQQGISKRSLARIKDCIQFALEPLLTKTHSDSFGFVKRLAENIKRTKIVDAPDDKQRNENIYAVCDLVSLYVIQRSAQFAVGVIEPDNKSVVRFLPSRLFTQVIAFSRFSDVINACYSPQDPRTPTITFRANSISI